MQHYIYVLKLNRPEAFDNPTADETSTIERHFEYLKRLTAEGVVLMAGPCTDGAFGLVLFKAEDETAAKGVVASDPVVQSGVMSAELHPFRISLGIRS